MKQITLPDKISIKDLKNNQYQVVIEPCYPGFGVTLGNALRRVLLSSLEGGAVTSFRVEGAKHEFDSIENIKEDLIEIMLNLKQLRLKVFSDEPVKLKLEAKGEKVVTAADIAKNSDVEIINKDLVIATLTDKQAKLTMEITAEKGLGYVTVEQKNKGEKLEISNIAIDSSFSPVLNIGYSIENVRVGEMTNYEKLILEIQTDGSITPKSAIQSAVNILVNEFEYLLNLDDAISKKSVSKDSKQEEVNEQPDEEIAEKVEELADKKEKKRGRPKKNDK